MVRQVTDYFLYRWRYGLGYLFVATAIITTIIGAGVFVPGEIRQGEIDAAITSSQLSYQNLTPGMVISAPYYGLQKLSFATLGVTPLSIKLPSMIIALGTALGLFLLFKTWFSRNIGLIAVALVSLTAQFLFLAQDGTPGIAFSGLTVWLLYAATQAIRTKKMLSTLWKITACIIAALLLYMPLGVYVVVSLGVLALSHPHTRYTILRVQRSRLLAASVLGFVAILPLLYASSIDHSIIKQLLGIPAQPISITENLTQLVVSLAGVLTPGSSYLVQPLYSIGMMLIMLVGLVYLIGNYYTARSYAVVLMGLPILAVVLINPHLVTALFPVSALLVAFGISWLINHWYGMFPRNPYARVAGLLPMLVLIGGLSLTGVDRYIEAYRYNPDILSHYSSDLGLLNDRLDTIQARVDQPVVLAVTEDESPFYEVVARYDKRLRVTTTLPSDQTTFTATRAYRQNHNNLSQPVTILTNSRASDSNRFYVYEPL